MKKVYSKPEIVFEDFTIGTNIAGSCEVKTNTPNSGKCAYEYNDEFIGKVFLFTGEISACKDCEDDGEHNGFCYHTPTESNNLFNS